MVKEGFRMVYNSKNMYINNNNFNNIWCSVGIPKVNMLFWILAHRKTLTAENLRKRGIAGPSRYILWKEEKEILEHLFTECKFTQEVWSIMLKELKMNITMPTNWNDIFFSWKDYYQGSFKQKLDFARAWEAFPKVYMLKNFDYQKQGSF